MGEEEESERDLALGTDRDKYNHATWSNRVTTNVNDSLVGVGNCESDDCTGSEVG